MNQQPTLRTSVQGRNSAANGLIDFIPLPGLKTAPELLGLDDIRFITAQGLNPGEDSRRTSLDQARRELEQLVNELDRSRRGQSDSREAA